ncbi:MAG: cysteine rich repeat-containing protein [Bdellovibrionaceae bacterium]|nr:cysteine rich repeat-containing protein [Pseudobdellovibrionaceae bacterium]
MKMILSTLALMMAFVSAPALADRHEVKEACKNDIEKLCKGTKPGKGEVMKCLKEHEAQVSAECKAAGQEMKHDMKAAHEACKADLEKFCGDIKPGKGRKIKCLKKHEAELSAECKSARESLKD